MIGDLEQDAARLRPHPLDGAALQNDAVAWNSPLDRGRNVLAFFDFRDRRLRHIEIDQPLSGSPAIRTVAAGRLRRNGGDIFGGCGGHGGAIDLYQGLALDDVRARRDIGDLQDEAFGPHRDDGDAALVELDGAWRADHRADHAWRHRLRFHTGALDPARR